jgi:hypothetical protein
MLSAPVLELPALAAIIPGIREGQAPKAVRDLNGRGNVVALMRVNSPPVVSRVFDVYRLIVSAILTAISNLVDARSY